MNIIICQCPKYDILTQIAPANSFLVLLGGTGDNFEAQIYSLFQKYLLIVTK